MLEGVAVPAATSFIEVTVLVAIMTGLFSYLQYRPGSCLTRFLLDHWRAGPMLGPVAGVIPGCGGAIVVIATLLANALSQDGDALLPLLLMDRRSAIIASVVTTIPGLVVGTLVLFLGVAP